MKSKVLEYIEKKENWKEELSRIRKALLELPFEETIKWGAPTYTYEGKNIVGLKLFL